MARRRRQRRRGNGEGATIAAGAAVTLFCLLVFGAFLYWKLNAEHPPTLVAETLCPVEGPRSLTVVLIDSSDDIPEIGRRELEGYLFDIADGIAHYGLLELRLMRPDTLGGQLLFSRCNPGDGSNLSNLTANPALAKQRWADQFKQPLASALESGLASAGADRSPILGTLQAIAVDRFSGNAAKDKPKQLIVISDMLEHGPDYSHYADDPGYERFAGTRAARRFATNLEGADVIIRYIDRPGARVDSVALIDFWQRWINDNGGNLGSVERVQGAG